MTWAFVYLACLLVGLLLAAVSGLFGDVRSFLQNHPVAPAPDQQPTLLGGLALRLGAGLCGFGGAGLVLAVRGREHAVATFAGAAVVGLAAVAATFLLRRRRPRPPRPSVAVVVRDIPPNGYGQIRLPQHAGGLLLAARTDEQQAIPAGLEVEVVDSECTVVLVRRPRP